MKNTFLIIAFLLALYSFNSNANTINRNDAYVCKDDVSGEVLGHASSYEGCEIYKEQATHFPLCTGPSFYQFSDRHYIRCWRGIAKPHLMRITRTQLDTCPSSHAIDNGDGTCSFGEPPPPPPPPTCPEEGTFYKSLYGPASFNNRKSCFPNNCAIAFQTESSVYVETESDGVWKTSLELFYTGESCSYSADNASVVEMSHVFSVPDNVHPTGDAPPENYEPIYQNDTPSYNGGDSSSDLPTDNSSTPLPNPEPIAKDPDSELTKAENSIVGEVSISNQHLENITHELGQILDQDSSTNGHIISYQKHMLTELKKLNEQSTSGGGSQVGGDNSGTTPSVANYSCDSTAPNLFQCEGDVILCMQAKIQYDNHCVTEHINSLESALADQFNNIDNAAAIVQEDVVNLAELDTRYLDNGIQVQGSCPAPIDASYTNPLSGRSETFSIDYTAFCTLIEWLAPIIVALGWLSGIYVIGRLQGVY
ncbi:virulence factor TspB C-terminal domain-related protein [Vibrio fluminensis]|uniref:virulence factor TspB C-terminal domain-related protein n=1 Tax=Vibrio fluminensis TaxID=2783614 RepID=UPI0018874043|nr:virulence factor TspB C-terminal domain-related protein [Vibrio fluminensis]